MQSTTGMSRSSERGCGNARPRCLGVLGEHRLRFRLDLGHAHVPLAHRAIARAAFHEIHVDVVLVIAVGTGAQHRREAGAHALLPALAEILRHMNVGRVDGLAVDQRDRAHVDRVALAVLAHHRPDDVVAAAAVIGRVVSHRANARSEIEGRELRQVVAHPVGDRLGHVATEHGRRIDLDPAAVGEDDRLEPHQIAAAAVAGALDGIDRRRNRALGGQPDTAGGRRRRWRRRWRRSRRTGGRRFLIGKRARARQRNGLRHRNFGQGHECDDDGATAFHVTGFCTNCGFSVPDSAATVPSAQLIASAMPSLPAW